MPHRRILQVGIMVAGTLLLIATTLKSQSPARSPQVWEYSSVSGMPVSFNTTTSGITPAWVSSAAICYAAAQGCRRENITADVSNQGEGAEAMMIAAAKLGADGWELTASTEVMDGSYAKRVLYFRRLKPDSK